MSSANVGATLGNQVTQRCYAEGVEHEPALASFSVLAPKHNVDLIAMPKNGSIWIV